MTEASPDPHNEAIVTEMPVRTDQAQETGERNIAQAANTRDGRLHPSVADALEGGVADHDSMFNNADPQSGAMGTSGARFPEDTREHDKGKKSA
jgi:hypothetical protein